MSDITGNAKVVSTITLTGNIKYSPTLVGVAWGKITGTLADQEDLQSELNLLHSQDVSLSELIDREEQRAVAVEKTLSNSISSEADARTKADNALQSNIDAEITRAKARENEIEAKIPSHDNFATKTELSAEVTRAKAREDEIEKKIPTDFYTKEEVDKLIQNLIDSINANTYLTIK